MQPATNLESTMRQLALLLLFVPIYGWGQPTGTSAPQPHEGCRPGLFINVQHEDTVKQCAIIDSITKLMVGRWELVEEGAGDCFVPAHAPARMTQITINQQGEGLLFIAGSRGVWFQLLLSYYYANVHFAMVQNGYSGYSNYFEFFPPNKRPKRKGIPDRTGYYPNILRVCEETLIMYGPRTGLSYVFRRMRD